MAKAPTLPTRVGSVKLKACLECGKIIAAGRPKEAKFCVVVPGEPSCKTAFHNRRQKRGAILYDFYMATRFERERAEALGFQTDMARVASTFRGMDQETRAGRKSWIDPDDYVAMNPHLHAKHLY